MDASELLKRYAAGERNFCGADLKDIDLSGENLIGIDLSDSNLEKANLTNSNLMGANLNSAKIINANLVNAILVNANLKNAWVNSSNFSRADLNGANLRSTKLGGANFSKSNLSYAVLDRSNIWWSYDWSYLGHEDLDSFLDLVDAPINFSGANLKNASLKYAQLDSSDFSSVNLKLADFRQTNLKFSNFAEACLDEAEFIGASLDSCIFKSASLVDANFTGAVLNQANFCDVVAGGIVYVDHKDHYSQTNFTRAKLNRANFRSAKLDGTSFMDSDLSECDFRDAELEQVDFSESNISGAYFNNVKSDTLSRAFFYASNEPCGLATSELENIKATLKRLYYPYKQELISGRESSRKVFLEALEKTTKRLILVNPWLTNHAIDEEILCGFREVLNRRCRIDIGWGSLSDIEKKVTTVSRNGLLSKMSQKESWKYNALPQLECLEKVYQSQFNLKLIGTHEKYLVCDHSFAMIGSHNFLTSGDRSNEREMGIRFDDHQTITELIKKFDSSDDLDFW
jgi:uncharacterized protein YjbI with pentapeptide repeats